MTAPEQDSLVQAIVEKLDERDAHLKDNTRDDLKLFRGIVRAKDIVAAVVFFVCLIGGGAIVVQELREKPSTEDMTNAIEKRVAPVEDIAKANTKAVSRVEKKVDALKGGTEQVLEEVRFQGKQLDCLGDKNCKKMPERDAPDVNLGEAPK